MNPPASRPPTSHLPPSPTSHHPPPLDAAAPTVNIASAFFFSLSHLKKHFPTTVKGRWAGREWVWREGGGIGDGCLVVVGLDVLPLPRRLGPQSVYIWHCLSPGPPPQTGREAAAGGSECQSQVCYSGIITSLPFITNCTFSMLYFYPSIRKLSLEWWKNCYAQVCFDRG